MSITAGLLADEIGALAQRARAAEANRELFTLALQPQHPLHSAAEGLLLARLEQRCAAQQLDGWLLPLATADANTNVVAAAQSARQKLR